MEFGWTQNRFGFYDLKRPDQSNLNRLFKLVFAPFSVFKQNIQMFSNIYKQVQFH